MSQTFLDENPPKILDATCSFSKRWPAHATIRMDIRPECKPDVVGDARRTDFPDAYFDEEYLDPPHLFRRGGTETIKRLRREKYHRWFSPDPFTRYGTWGSREEWLDFISKALTEAHRILKPTGLLHIKLTESKDKKMKVEDVSASPLFEVVKHKITTSVSNFSKSKAKVHWLTMRPKP